MAAIQRAVEPAAAWLAGVRAERDQYLAQLQAVAAYARRVLVATDGMWPPAMRATECRRALKNIEAECPVRPAVTANDKETRR